MKYVLSVDYDGTLFNGTWPKLGKPIKDVIRQVKAFKDVGAEVVLWTCREGKSLQEAVGRCAQEGVYFDSINEPSPSQKEFQLQELNKSGNIFGIRKIFAHIYVDDRSPGSIEHFLKLDAKEEVGKIEKEDY